MRPRSHALARMLELVAATTLASLHADCGGTRDEGGACDPAKSTLGNVGLPPDLDYLAVRFESAQKPGEATVVEEVGALCRGARDVAACTKTALARRSPGGWTFHGPPVSDAGPAPHTYLLFTRGDEVGTATTDAALTALVGPIDTRAKAALVAGLRLHEARTCDRMEPAGGGGFRFTEETDVCPSSPLTVERTTYTVGADANVSKGETTRVEKSGLCATGRRPERFEAIGSPAPTGGAAALLAEVAELEAASVFAFERLARELAHHGAPASLVARARLAAADEVRHARLMAEHAARYAGPPRDVSAPALGPRELEAIAEENAVEGCVRETLGALVALWQAATARDDALRQTMRAIADDELEHAALAWDVAAWITPRLPPGAAARVRAARARAVEELRGAEVDASDDEARAALGLPDGRAHAALLDGLSPLFGETGSALAGSGSAL